MLPRQGEVPEGPGPSAASGGAGLSGGLGEGACLGVVGQPEAVATLRAAAARPVHAYLLLGPPGTGKLAAARWFASMLLCPAGGGDGCETCARVASGVHPDFMVVEREGASMSVDQAREVTRVAARSSVEGGRSVVVLPELHLARDAVPALLKTLEEPPADVVFIALADYLPPELVTVASRCVQVRFRPLSDQDIVGALLAEGVSAQQAAASAQMAGGRLDRARLLAGDPAAEARARAWESVPTRLDGTGATAALLAEELLDLLKASAAPLVASQEAEMAALVERNSRSVVTAPARMSQAAARSGTKELEDKHRREQRRQRSDELRAGLASLARAYRQMALAGGTGPRVAASAVALLDGLSADLEFNPGEQLALQALLVRLSRLS